MNLKKNNITSKHNRRSGLLFVLGLVVLVCFLSTDCKSKPKKIVPGLAANESDPGVQLDQKYNKQRRGRDRMIPDTLDLAQRGEYALNALAGTVDPDHHCEFLFGGNFKPPSVRHDAYSFAACGPKYLESWAMLRTMSGSDLHTAMEKCAGDYIYSCLSLDDGLFYNIIGPERPWDKSSPEDWANIYGQARMLRAMLAISQIDDDPIWMERMEKIVKTLIKIAVYKEDYAYFPTTPGYGDIFSYPRSGWKITELHTGAQETMADLPDHSFGIPLYLGGLLEPLTNYYMRTGDEGALELAGKLVTFLLKPESAWQPDGFPRGVVPHEHGWFYGHFHGHTLCLRGLLNYAIAVNDMKLKNLVRDGYQYARTLGIARLGWFQEYTGKHSHETCGLANMTALAIKLSRSGVGDYWDDVDGYARNHLTQAQFIDMTAAKQANENLTPEQSKLLDRHQGAFAGWGPPNHLSTNIMNCCLANGSQALYYAWDGILQADDASRVTINLLLNRVSPWIEVDSFLPYEGKIVLRNKTAKKVHVRIPAWVDKAKVNVAFKRRSVDFGWLNNYLLLDDVQPGQIITITFPMKTSTESYEIWDYGHRGTEINHKYHWTITFKGNTAVSISPEAPQAMYPTYQRKSMLKEPSPMRTVKPYVPIRHINW